jgi:hypothetical protein
MGGRSPGLNTEPSRYEAGREVYQVRRGEKRASYEDVLIRGRFLYKEESYEAESASRLHQDEFIPRPVYCSTLKEAEFYPIVLYIF